MILKIPQLMPQSLLMMSNTAQMIQHMICHLNLEVGQFSETDYGAPGIDITLVNGAKISTTITEYYGQLLLSLGSAYASNIWGLCGNFDNDPDDDFPDNGTDALDEDYLQLFRYMRNLTQVTQSNSLFNYSSPYPPYNQVNNASYLPVDSYPTDGPLYTEAVEICSQLSDPTQNATCIFDIMATGDINAASSTLGSAIAGCQESSSSASVADCTKFGAGCPYLCSLHGQCVSGACVCSKGFYGDACQNRGVAPTPAVTTQSNASAIYANLLLIVICIVAIF